MSPEAAAWQDAIAARTGQHERGRRQYAQLIQAADMPYEQRGRTPVDDGGRGAPSGPRQQERRRRHAAAAPHAPGRSAAGAGSVLNNLKSIPADLSVA